MVLHSQGILDILVDLLVFFTLLYEFCECLLLLVLFIQCEYFGKSFLEGFSSLGKEELLRMAEVLQERCALEEGAHHTR